MVAADSLEHLRAHGARKTALDHLLPHWGALRTLSHSSKDDTTYYFFQSSRTDFGVAPHESWYQRTQRSAISRHSSGPSQAPSQARFRHDVLRGGGALPLDRADDVLELDNVLQEHIRVPRQSPITTKFCGSGDSCLFKSALNAIAQSFRSIFR